MRLNAQHRTRSSELPGAITTEIVGKQQRDECLDSKGLGKPPVFSGREKTSWAKKVENYVSGVFPNESQDAITAAAVALGVPGLGAEASAEIDAQLFVALSALTDNESFGRSRPWL